MNASLFLAVGAGGSLMPVHCGLLFFEPILGGLK
jgi:hypothetical protein